MNLINELKNPKYYNEVFQDIIDKNKKIDTKFRFENLLQEIIKGEFKWSPPKRVMIPKSNGIDFREIFIFDGKDSLLQKTLCKILNFKKGYLINDNVFSYKKGISIFFIIIVGK